MTPQTFGTVSDIFIDFPKKQEVSFIYLHVYLFIHLVIYLFISFLTSCSYSIKWIYKEHLLNCNVLEKERCDVM